MERVDSIVIFYRNSASALAAAPLAIFQPLRGDSGPLERVSVSWILYTEGKAPAPLPGLRLELTFHGLRPFCMIYSAKLPAASVFSR